MTNITPEQTDELLEDSLDETTRNLATVTSIAAIEVIPDADNIVAVRFTSNYWACIAAKGEFKVGDKAVYFEVDSFLPRHVAYDAFLEKRGVKVMDGREGYRLKTVRLRGQVSQGLAVPLNKFDVKQFYEDGYDVTEILGIKKYRPPTERGYGFNLGEMSGPFPGFVPKSDQHRLDSYATVRMMDLVQHTFEVTEKLHGSSCTMFIKLLQAYGEPCPDDEPYAERHLRFGVCSRNTEKREPGTVTAVSYERRLDAGEVTEEGDYTKPDGSVWRKETKERVAGDCAFWDMERKYAVRERLTKYCSLNRLQLAIQGEMCGPGINKNMLKLDDKCLFVYDIYDIERGEHLMPETRLRVLAEINDIITGYPPIMHVPVIYDNFGISPQVEQIESAAKVVREMTERPEEFQAVTHWSSFMRAAMGAVIRKLQVVSQAPTFNHSCSQREGLVFKSNQRPGVSFKIINQQHELNQK